MQCETNSCVLISDGDLIFYYTNFYIEDGYLIIKDNVNYLLTDGRYIESAKKQANAKCYLQKDLSVFGLLKKLQVKKVGLVYGYTSALLLDSLIKNDYLVFDYTDENNDLISVKSHLQLAKIKKACEITEKAFIKTLPCIKEGVTELEVAAVLEYNFKMLGGSTAFETIVAFGSGGSVPHYVTGSKKLEKNMPILMDFGASYQGFLSDMTRTLFFGTPTDKFLNVYDKVKNAHLKAVSEIRSGMLCCEADGISRNYLKEFGLDNYFTHSLGHGIGVKIHEFPTLNPKSQTVLKDGMVFSVEPGVYLEGEFGVRIEDTVTLVNGKCKSLMNLGKDPIIISVE